LRGVFIKAIIFLANFDIRFAQVPRRFSVVELLYNETALV